MLDNQQIQNNWPKIKSMILSRWNKLSEADVEKSHGDVIYLGDLIEKSYGAKEDFATDYETLCNTYLSCTPSSYTSTDPIKSSSKSAMNSRISVETEMSESAMDKDRDDTYLSGPNGVTRAANISERNNPFKKTFNKEKVNESNADGFNNVDRSSGLFARDPGHVLEEELLMPDLKGMDAVDTQITLMNEFEEFNESKRKHSKIKQNIVNNKQAPDEFKTNQVPRLKEKDITLGRSNSSANTTSPSALTSSEAMSKDTKKL